MAETHKETLQLALDETNQKYIEFDTTRRAEAEKERREREAHDQHVREAAKKIKFD